MSTPEFKQLRSRVDYLVHAEEDELDPALQDLPKNSTYDSGQYRKISKTLKAQVQLGLFIY